MTRTRADSVPQRARAAGRPALSRPLRRWLAGELRALRPAVAASAARCDAERYRKHFDSFAHTSLLLFHGLAGSPSLRQSYDTFSDCPGLVALAGLAPADAAAAEAGRLAVSFSQVAASNTSRPPAFLGGLVPTLAARVRALGGARGRAVPPDLSVLDSTFLRLGRGRAPWLPLLARPERSGVRVQLRYAPAADLPEHFLVTDLRTPDCRGLDHAILDDPAQVVALRGRTLVLDLGYYSHARFARLLAAGVHVLSRLHPQATVRVEADRPVQATLPGLDGGRITVLADQQVTVGSPGNRAGGVLRGLRLVTARVAPQATAARRGAQPVTYRILTDRWDLDAAAVILGYLLRWQIELFLRWLKSHVRLPRLLGTSPAAVELTLWLAIVVHLLTLLAAHARGHGRRSPSLLRRLAWTLTRLTVADLVEAAPVAYQLPLPDPPPTEPGSPHHHET